MDGYNTNTLRIRWDDALARWQLNQEACKTADKITRNAVSEFATIESLTDPALPGTKFI